MNKRFAMLAAVAASALALSACEMMPMNDDDDDSGFEESDD